MNTKKRHLEIYDTAVKILNTAGGVEVIDKLPEDERLLALRKMYQNVMKQAGCTLTPAKANLAKAMRRARYGVMVENWGGSRLGAGRPPKEIKMFKKYQITVKPVEDGEVGNLQFLFRIPDDGVIAYDYIDTDKAGNEIYEIEIDDAFAGFVESNLDQTGGVVGYEEI